MSRATRKNGGRFRVDSTTVYALVMLNVLDFVFLRQPPKSTSKSTCQLCMSLVASCRLECHGSMKRTPASVLVLFVLGHDNFGAHALFAAPFDSLLRVRLGLPQLWQGRALRSTKTSKRSKTCARVSSTSFRYTAMSDRCVTPESLVVYV